MIYTKREKLTCYIIEDNSDQISFDALKPLLMDRPSNIIYCEKSGKLYGIISMGDIRRSYHCQQNFVTINKSFTKLFPGQYMKARQLFKDHNGINGLPIVDAHDRLLGAYTRWNDLISFTDFNYIKHNPRAISFWKTIKRIALVAPCDIFSAKKELMQQWYEALTEINIPVDVISKDSLPDVSNRYNYILFTDEDELRGTYELYYSLNNGYFDVSKERTFSQFINNMTDITASVFHTLMEKGIFVLTLQEADNHSSYYQNLLKDIFAKFQTADMFPTNHLPQELMADFFQDLYSPEYAKAITHLPISISTDVGVSKLSDVESTYYNATNGERFTPWQPQTYTQTIYFFGPCVIVGAYVEDKYTIESFLQKKLNENNYSVRVVNYGCWPSNQTLLNRICQTTFQKGDIVVVYTHKQTYSNIPKLNLTDICEKNNIPASWLVNSVAHCNHMANQCHSDAIYSVLENRLAVHSPLISEDIRLGVSFLVAEYIHNNFYDYDSKLYNKIGSIVMNCNPFTKGHRYLIEQALTQVDFLIIFVVEEDQSLFTFQERFSMVINGTSDLKNVKVVPSGNFILSKATFPEYFLKIEDSDLVHNVECDITLFAEQIAPKLNITYRFVGEEPFDPVTNEYNTAMKKILPQYNIKLVEIPRVKDNLTVISATAVRSIMNTEDRKQLEHFVPATTKNLLDFCLE